MFWIKTKQKQKKRGEWVQVRREVSMIIKKKIKKKEREQKKAISLMIDDLLKYLSTERYIHKYGWYCYKKTYSYMSNCCKSSQLIVLFISRALVRDGPKQKLASSEWRRSLKERNRSICISWRDFYAQNTKQKQIERKTRTTTTKNMQ